MPAKKQVKLFVQLLTMKGKYRTINPQHIVEIEDDIERNSQVALIMVNNTRINISQEVFETHIKPFIE